MLIPLRELPARVGELEAQKERPIIAVCRSGVRSTTAAAILTGLGFENVSNLKRRDAGVAGAGVRGRAVIRSAATSDECSRHKIENVPIEGS